MHAGVGALSLVAVLLLPACHAAHGMEDPDGVPIEFEQYELALGFAEHQTVLTGFFLGGPMADLAVVNVDEGDDRRLRLFAFDDGGWTPQLDVSLGPDVQFVDVARIGERDRLIMFGRGRLDWFDPDTERVRMLGVVGTEYNPVHDLEGSPTQQESRPPRVDITRDVNGDGRDDLVVPDLDGFWIAVQEDDGSFAEAVKLGPPEPFLDEVSVADPRSYREVGMTAVTIPWALDRVHQLDYDQDGRSDLAFWSEGHFDLYLQGEDGRFDPVPERFTTDVPFDADGVYSLMFGWGEVDSLTSILGIGKKKTRRTVLRSLSDMNGDGVADMLIQTLEGRSLMKQRSVYELHVGTARPGGTVFDQQVATTIRPRGIAGGMEPSGYASQVIRDFDGDGQVDVMFRDVAFGMGGVTRAMMGHSIPVDLEFHRLKDGLAPDDATTRRKIRPKLAPFYDGVFFPTILVGDVNGDGRADLLAGESSEELHIYLGVPGEDLLARTPQEVAVALPDDERNTRLADLDGNGKLDLLVHHTPTGTDPDAPHRVTLLISK
jgi:hypothetical protein